jgi:formylglycine-generating enzyme required for sulfatase activity
MSRKPPASVAFLAFLALSCRDGGDGLAAGDRRSFVAKDGMEYLSVPPGRYQMGCVPADSECEPREKPRHTVTIARGFWLGRTEVTVAAYRRFAAATGRPMPAAPDFNRGWLHDTHPMVKVSWHDAAAYCGWTGGRLPTEEEWEYAARASRETKYPWGNTIGHDRANYGRDECCGGLEQGQDRWASTSPVGSFPPNDFGLHDMSGNVWEWCEDAYRADAYQVPVSSPAAAGASPTERVLRGGGWSSDPWLTRLSYRLGSDPGSDSNYVGGFRCLMDLRP